MQIDHVVVLVNDLAAAVREYSERGFTVVAGGKHTDGATHNALIAFADDSYIELIAFLRAAPEHRWWRHTAHGEGPIDWALLPDAIASEIAALQARGLDYSGPTAGGRLRPDGEELRWQTGLAPSAELPFLCADLTPRALRVPQGAAQQHANGVSGLQQITISARDIAASTARYAALLNGARAGKFQIGATSILLQPGERDGVGSLALQSPNGTTTLP